jgi:hypothetical protein
VKHPDRLKRGSEIWVILPNLGEICNPKMTSARANKNKILKDVDRHSFEIINESAGVLTGTFNNPNRMVIGCKNLPLMENFCHAAWPPANNQSVRESI